MSRRTHASSPAGDGLQVATGTYTGDGAATQAIVGIGFQPTFVIVYNSTVGQVFLDVCYKTDVDGIFTQYTSAGTAGRYEVDHIISLDADGFTVGDGTGAPWGNVCNIADTGYVFIAFR